MVKDQDYTLSYDNNIKCGKGTVTATGIGTFGSDTDAWFVIVPAKGKINKLTPGENKVTVSFESQSDTVTSDKVLEKAKEASDGDPADSASVAGTYKQIQALKKDGDLKGSSFLPLGLRSNKVSSSKIRLNWKKVSEADGYILYGNRCGSKYRMKKLAQLSSSKNTWVYKKLKKGKYYKFLIVAYKIKGGKIILLP